MSEVVTLVIQHQVRRESLPTYETWLRNIAGEAMRFPGHMGVNVIRPQGASTNYVIVLRFASHDQLRSWIESATRQRLVEVATPMLVKAEDLEIQTGLEYWFTPENPKPLHARRYKQFLVTLSAIYPLTLIVPWALRPLQEFIHFLRWPMASALLCAVVIVFLMVYVIMPRYTRLVARWLFA